MIKIVNTASLSFEQIVVEELAQPFAAHGFRVEPTFPLYKNQTVAFMRQREGQKEKLELQRAVHGNEYLASSEVEGEVESSPIRYDDELHWVSRHTLCVHFIVDGATNWLQRNGKAGTGDDYWWHFTDEQDLRRLLRELLPVILAAGQETFDDVPLETPTAA